jgi:hypothetical protein
MIYLYVILKIFNIKRNFTPGSRLNENRVVNNEMKSIKQKNESS